ncbi:MAG: hypothetical protein GF418_13620 [Chitinivibrionales bacterium]|nr:hypothetical protein [Chitinivibrionales bacterium]MBD3396659.1 hypothetical protein [Chitinivibrionales bacterium]
MRATLILLTLTSCALPGPLRLFCIGNSFTFYHGGIPSLVHDIGASLDPPEEVTGSYRAGGGYSLHSYTGIDYQVKDDVLADIRNSNADILLLQDHRVNPRNHFDDPVDFKGFRGAALALAEAGRNAGAETYFFMTWCAWDSMHAVRNDSLYIDIELAAYERVAAECGATVVPVGMAYDRVLRERPDLVLWDGIDIPTSTKAHVTRAGGFLNACVFLAAFTGRDPRDTDWILEYADNFLETQEDIDYIRTVAWETVQSYNRGAVVSCHPRIRHSLRNAAEPETASSMGVYNLRGAWLGFDYANRHARGSIAAQITLWSTGGTRPDRHISFPSGHGGK